MTSPLMRPVVRVAQYKSKLEADYATLLDARLGADVAWWGYESLSFAIGNGAHYRPDFAVQQRGGEMQIHEAKGFMREAARVRLLVAARMFPMFTWWIVRRGTNGALFDFEEVTP